MPKSKITKDMIQHGIFQSACIQNFNLDSG
jgi:hypothetical protein